MNLARLLSLFDKIKYIELTGSTNLDFYFTYKEEDYKDTYGWIRKQEPHVFMTSAGIEDLIQTSEHFKGLKNAPLRGKNE